MTQMKSSEFVDDLTDLAKVDAKSGYMTDPVLLVEECIKDIFLSRRTPCREIKESLGHFRTRPVDHGSESFLKVAVWVEERTVVQGLEFLTTMAFYCYISGGTPRM